MKISLRPFTKEDLPQYKRWREEVTASQYMSRFYPHSFAEDGTTCSDLYRWYVIQANGEQVGTVWLEKGDLKDEVATLGILIGEEDHLGTGIGGRAIPLAIESASEDLGFKAVHLRVRKQNQRAIACYENCGFYTLGEGCKVTEHGELIHFLEMQLHFQ